jgi:MoaA/NifB/PqqE/SkfB family radical SAM enzyme
MDTAQKAGDPPFLRNVGLLLTFHCQASCAHCILRAGPDRHEEANLEDARNWIRQIASYRNHYVCVLSLTGGEPFSNLKLLRKVMEFATECKLYVSVVTNGFWATKRETAKQLLQSLPEICFLSISTDVYHQKYVPFEHVKNAIWATQECEIPYYVSIVTENTSDADYQRVNSEILELTAPENIRTGITFPVGRASQMTSQLRYSLSDEPPKEACQAASSPCIFPDGRVYGCIGPLIGLQHEHPLLLGNLRETSLAEILDRSETNVVLHALRLWGPNRLISLLREAGLGQRLPIKYVEGSVCNACYSLLSDVVVREWLFQLEQDAEFRRKVAYGRLYYLNESGMLELGDF